MTDAEALQTYARRRDAEAFRQLVHAYQGMVYAACRRRLRCPSDVEDAVQETFLKLAKAAGTVRSNVAAWLYRCATRTAIDLARRDSARRDRERTHAARYVESYDDDPAWTEIRRHVDDALAEMGRADRSLIVEYYLHGRTQTDLAGEAGLTQSGVKRRLDRAVENLRGRLRRRGVVVPAACIVAFFAAESANAQVPTALTANLIKIGLANVGAGNTATGGILMATASTKAKVAAAAVAVALVATTTTVVVSQKFANTAGSSSQGQTPTAVSQPDFSSLQPDVSFSEMVEKTMPIQTFVYADGMAAVDRPEAVGQEIIPTLFASLSQHQIRPTGPLQCVFSDTELWFALPVAGSPPPDAEDAFRTLPEQKCVSMRYYGPVLDHELVGAYVAHRAVEAGYDLTGQGRAVYHHFVDLGSDENETEILLVIR